MKRTAKLTLLCALLLLTAFAAAPPATGDPDPECEQICFEQYYECAQSCSACDQCSCQLAYCRAGCGVPFTGC